MRKIKIIAIALAATLASQQAAAQTATGDGFFQMETREGRLREVLNKERSTSPSASGSYQGGGFVASGKAASAAPAEPAYERRKLNTAAHASPAQPGEVGRPKALWNRHPNELIHPPKRRYFTQW